MKIIAPFIAALSLCSCATMTPYSGPMSANTAKVTLGATGLMKHAAFPDDKLFIHLLSGNASDVLGTVKLTTDRPSQEIMIDRDKPLMLRFMSVQAHFGGYTYCNRDIPFLASELTGYLVTYATQKSKCTINVSALNSDGAPITISEYDGVFGGVQVNAHVAP